MKFKIIVTSIFLFAFFLGCSQARQIIQARGGRVKVIQYDDGRWEMLVDNDPYFIRGVVYIKVMII